MSNDAKIQAMKQYEMKIMHSVSSLSTPHILFKPNSLFLRVALLGNIKLMTVVKKPNQIVLLSDD